MGSWIKKVDPALVIAIFLAAVLWLSFSLTEDHVKNLKLKIDLGVPEGKSLVREFPSEIRVNYSAPGYELIRFKFKRPLVISLENQNEQTIRSESIINEISQQFSLPRQSITGISFTDQLVQLDNTVSKIFRLPMDKIQFELPKNYLLVEAVKIIPDSVEITGAERLIENLDLSNVLMKDFGELSESVIEKVALNIPTKILQFEQEEVETFIEVERSTEKEISIPIEMDQEISNFKMIPEQVMVKFLVGLSKYDEISGNDFRARLVIEDIKNQYHQIILEKYPEGIILEGLSSDSAQLIIFQEQKNPPK